MKRALFAIAFAAIGCQTYDFEPVTPLAIGQTTQITNIAVHGLKPNVMLLLDKSGSMLTNTSTAAPCPSTIGACGPNSPCPANCPTRISDLKSAMTAFLTSPMSATVARVGVAYFPKDNVCTPTSQLEVLVDLPVPSLGDDLNALTTQSANVNIAIGGLMPGGGTPTADSIRFVGSIEELQDGNRENFVLLLTDGVPNCNANNPNSCNSPNNACQCTGSSCAGQLCQLGCLNADDSVTAISELRKKTREIKTIVVGFGACGQAGNQSADCANAPQTLNRMALAGGFARSCKADVDCQTMGVMDTCDLASHNCNQAYFAAANATELSAALAKISEAFNMTPCTVQLSDAPSDPRYLSVTVNGQPQQGCGISAMGAMVPGCNTWTYDDSAGVAQVTFQGTTCDEVKAATTQNPLPVEFRIVKTL